MEPIRYRVCFPALASHLFEVEATYPTEGRNTLELMLAVWTPGSYLVREYSRHLEQVRALDGVIEKVAKNRWRLTELIGERVTVRYVVYAREMSVRTNWVEPDFAILNGAPTFLTLADDDRGPRGHLVTLEMPAAWTESVTALPATGEPHVYLADSYDTLVDSPMLLGTPASVTFEAGGKTHRLATVGDDGLFDGERAAADLQKVVTAQQELWGVVPYEEYVFLNVLTESGGGLEHKNSTVLMGTRWATRSRGAYLGEFAREPGRHGWLGLASHEFFHVWNGKRLHPKALGPFAYESENYTRELWFVEGVTSYYDDLMLARVGLLNAEEYLQSLSRNIERLQTGPGRAVRSAELSSFDAWIREYRPDENAANASISYYTKGSVVAFLLDMEIRRLSDGGRSLDDVLRAAYARYADASGYTGEELWALISEVAGQDLGPWLRRAVSSTDELDYDAALAWLGLTFVPVAPEGSETTAVWLGATTKVDSGRLLVTQIWRGSPAAQGGLTVDDEIVALNGYRVRPDQWGRRLEEYRPGDGLRLLVARRDRMRELTVQAGQKPARPGQLLQDPAASREQLERLKAWLHIEPSNMSTGLS